MISRTKRKLLMIPVLCLGSVVWSQNTTARSQEPAEKPAQEIRGQLTAMLQGIAAIKPLPDIPGGAPNADLEDAAWYAWQEFVALNWPNMPVNGRAAELGPDGGPSADFPFSAREIADTSKQFGEPASPGMVDGMQVSYPALVWESTRHRVELFPGYGVTPGGYVDNAAVYWGYDALPEYKYVGTVEPASGTDPLLTPWNNLDETSQIGTAQMFTGVPAGDAAADGPFLPARFVLFEAKANRAEYGYTTSRGWYNTSNVGGRFDNTKGYIVINQRMPPAGEVNGSADPGEFVSLPNNTIELKAAFRLLTENEQEAYHAGRPVPGGYHVAPIRYYIGVEGTDAFEYVDTMGVLLGLHIIHKTPSAPYFIFATFEHTDNIRDDHGNSVEDANGELNANAYVSTETTVPAGYVYPSSGPPPPPGQFLIAATTPNVVTRLANLGTVRQDFIPTPTTNGSRQTPYQSSYVNTRSVDAAGTKIGTLPTSQSFDASAGHLLVNRRRFSIPRTVIEVNADVHDLISEHGYGADNPWLNYKLVDVQWVPVGSMAEKTAGYLYGDTSKGAMPPHQVPASSFYLANSMIETNLVLAAFSGKFDRTNAADNLTITDFYTQDKKYTYTDPEGKVTSVTKKKDAPFFNVYYRGTGYNVGGCMGCHGNALVAGGDFSFILRFPQTRVGSHFVPGFVPDAAEIADSVEAIRKLLAKHGNFFRQ